MKPVQGADGSRVPLLRAGLDSSRAYTVSFVYLSIRDRVREERHLRHGPAEARHSDQPVDVGSVVARSARSETVWRQCSRGGATSRGGAGHIAALKIDDFDYGREPRGPK